MNNKSHLLSDCRNTITCYFFLLLWKLIIAKIIIIPNDAVVEKESHEPQNKNGCNFDTSINGCGISLLNSLNRRRRLCRILHSIRKILDIILTLLITHKKQTRQTDQIKHNYRIIRTVPFLACNTDRFFIVLSSNDHWSKLC